MVRAMRVRDVERALRAAGCSPKGGTRHAKWVCPCGMHSANIPCHTVVSPGVIADTIQRMLCLPKGWLQ